MEEDSTEEKVEGMGNLAAEALTAREQKVLNLPTERVTDLDVLYPLPRVPKEIKTPQMTVDTAANGQEESTTMHDAVKQLKADRASVADGGPAAKVLDAEIVKFQKAYDEHVKGLENSGLATVEGLRAKKKKALDDEAKRAATFANTASLKLEQFQKMRTAVQDEIDYWSKTLELMKDREENSLDKWAAWGKEKAAHAASVDTAWEAKIDALLNDVQNIQAAAKPAVAPVGEAAGAGNAPKAVGPGQAGAKAPTAMENLKEQQRLKEQRALMDKQQLELDQRMSLASNQQQPTDAPEQSQEVKDYYLSAPWSPLDLPDTVPKPKDGEYEYWITLAQHAQVWQERYSCAPCTYLELMGEVNDQSAAMASLVSVIGEQWWKKLYGQRFVLATDVVPCQLALVLSQALTQNRATAETAMGKQATEESMAKVKAKAKASMDDTAKRPKLKLVRKAVSK